MLCGCCPPTTIEHIIFGRNLLFISVLSKSSGVTLREGEGRLVANRGCTFLIIQSPFYRRLNICSQFAGKYCC